jgi:hypothetical protein
MSSGLTFICCSAATGARYKSMNFFFMSSSSQKGFGWRCARRQNIVSRTVGPQVV